MLCSGLDGTGVWGRMDTCICMTESLCCSPKTPTTLLIDCTPIQNVLGVKEIKIKSKQRMLGGEGIVRDFGKVMYTVLYLKWITNKDLFYSTWDSAQCYVAA